MRVDSDNWMYLSGQYENSAIRVSPHANQE